MKEYAIGIGRALAKAAVTLSTVFVNNPAVDRR
jgi:hypothetical protein